MDYSVHLSPAAVRRTDFKAKGLCSAAASPYLYVGGCGQGTLLIASGWLRIGEGVMTYEMHLDWLGDRLQLSVERALLEFRAGRPVAVRRRGSTLLSFAAEGLTGPQVEFLRQAGTKPRLIVPKGKLRVAAAVQPEPFTLEEIESWLNRGLRSANSGTAGVCPEFETASCGEAAAMALAALAQLLPAAAVTAPGSEFLKTIPVLEVEAEDIFAYRDRSVEGIRIAARTLIPLDGAGRCEFVVFRGGDGLRDQVAVIVGDPDPDGAVLTRIHSACLTGDLFGSLKCDCGEQLRGAVKMMTERGGGVLLYLDQEGRGNGIANKIRAYNLQDQGFDTYDADAILGFGPDQRRFDFAAEMLKQLGFNSVRLMTNNPRKIAALRTAGLEVVSTQSMVTRPTAHNAKYLAAKRDKGGHALGEITADGFDLDHAPERRPA
jgi:GTP cyclohydrolase II